MKSINVIINDNIKKFVKKNLNNIIKIIEETSLEHDEKDQGRFEQSREKKFFLCIKHNHHKQNIFGKLDKDMGLRKKIISQVSYVCYLSQVKPKIVKDALQDEN